MASEKFKELQNFSTEELQRELDLTEAQLEKLKFQHAVTGLENPNVLKAGRKDLARIKTEITRRKMNQMTEEELANRSRIRLRRSKR
jgi:large subunit ribosomal protein L29